jgi:hypothetical protein
MEFSIAMFDSRRLLEKMCVHRPMGNPFSLILHTPQTKPWRQVGNFHGIAMDDPPRRNWQSWRSAWPPWRQVDDWGARMATGNENDDLKIVSIHPIYILYMAIKWDK